MGILGWVGKNWFELLTTVGTVGGLFFASFTIRDDARARRIANLIALTQNHRELWKDFNKEPSLSRLLNPHADVVATPVTLEEQTFGTAMIQHLATVHRAMKTDLTIKPEGIRQDIRAFFALPVPKAVWTKFKKFQDADFAAFVDGCLS